MYHENAFSFVVLLCLVCSVMLFFFFFYHMWMIKNGLTTNERMKQGQATYYLERTKSFLEEWLKIREEEVKTKTKRKFEVHSSAEEYYGVKADWGIIKIKEKLNETIVGIDRVQNLPFAGDGFWSNLYGVAFPDATVWFNF